MITLGIPCYNEARNLPGLLDDLLRQAAGADFQFVLVDDASSDSTLQILEAYRARDPRIEIVRHEVRRGSTAAWNSIFEHARGDVLIRIDGDVRIGDPDFVATLARPLRANPGEPRLSYCSVVPRERPTTWVERGSGFIYRYIARQNAMGRWTPESLFCAVLGATRAFYADFRIPEGIVANDYYTARYALSRQLSVVIADTCATIKPAASLADFRKQGGRLASSRRQIEDVLGRTTPARLAAVPPILIEAIRDPRGAMSFLRLQSEIRPGPNTDVAWEPAETTK